MMGSPWLLAGTSMGNWVQVRLEESKSVYLKSRHLLLAVLCLKSRLHLVAVILLFGYLLLKELLYCMAFHSTANLGMELTMRWGFGGYGRLVLALALVMFMHFQAILGLDIGSRRTSGSLVELMFSRGITFYLLMQSFRLVLLILHVLQFMSFLFIL
ncbi:hypothetical protein TIFTF001_005479 [Ficus carica]|uniref:Uncharacterized protein n=1 Tax=Ficus carica TaxID=3494 RepID=A0AA88DES2_FICCA|nr:hypothetical protein TIFTF001_005479 [Ficus carica]